MVACLRGGSPVIIARACRDTLPRAMNVFSQQSDHPLFRYFTDEERTRVEELGNVRKILEGGESICGKAGIPIAGGHSIDTVEPIYGLVGQLTGQSAALAYRCRNS